MKTKIIVGAIAIVSSMALGAGSMFAVGQIVKGNSIGEENARNFAYVDAGVQPEGTIVDRTEFTMEKGIFVYDVGFRTNDTHYAYLIDSMSGTIIEKEIETVSGGSKSPDVDLAEGVQQEKIGVDKAKQIALSKAGVASGDAVFSKANLEYDNGKQIYDIEFIVVGKAKYEYEIDAVAGNVLEENIEKISISNQNNTTSAHTGVISIEEAKSTALRKAGLSSKDVVFSKAKLDRDDGMLIYEIDFYVLGKTEYEYEIDAVTGEILEQDIEPWEWDD